MPGSGGRAGPAGDPLAAFADEFVVADPELIYLDGNSLGRLPVRAIERVERALRREWGEELVQAWDRWIDLPTQIGDELAPLIGVGPGEVLLGDQTSVNLYKLASAALTPDRPDIVTDDANFPSDIYVLEGVAAAAGGRLRVVAVDAVAGVTVSDLHAALDGRVGLVSHSHVAFRSGAIADMAAITALAHDAGALTLWDLSHSVGAVPVDLAGTGADMAVGCTYKYLNGGPGAPAFLSVRRDLHQALRQPIRGWWGHRDMFGFATAFEEAPDIRRFAVGTPPILSMAAAGAGIELTAAAGVARLRAKSMALTERIVEFAAEHLADHGVRIGSPRDPARRGSHVALCHGDAYRLSTALRDRKVVVDYRAPDTIRLGIAPLYLSQVEVDAALQRLLDVLESKAHHDYPTDRAGVT